jgi:hypothetical protein
VTAVGSIGQWRSECIASTSMLAKFW